MDAPTFRGSDTATTHGRRADRENHGRTIGLLLLGLWATTAVGLLALPFLTQYRVVTPELRHDYTVDGWGRLDGLSGYGPRIGALLAVVAALLVLAVVATIRSRRATWPVWLGLLASTMAVTTSVLQLLKLEGMLRNEDVGAVAGAATDVNVGPVAWLIAAQGVLAGVAGVLSLVRLRRTARWTSTVDGPPYALMALCLMAAVALVLAPFLTLLEIGAVDDPNPYRVDGWERRQRAVGVPCTFLGIGLAVAAVAMAMERAAAWALRAGLLVGTAVAVVAGFQLIILEPILAGEDSVTEVSLGIGSWLILAAGVLAAVAVGLMLVRQSRPASGGRRTR